MKKIFTVFLILAILTTILVGCSARDTKSENNITVNKELNENEMYTIYGEKVVLKDNYKIMGDRNLGFAFEAPKSWESINENCLDFMYTDNALYIGYFPEETAAKIMDFNYDNITDEEIEKLFNESLANLFDFARIIRVVEDDPVSADEANTAQTEFENYVEIAKSGENIYYLAYNTEILTDGISETDNANIQTLIDSVDDLIESFMIFPADEMSAGNFEGSLAKFSATDMDGNTVTEEIFADYDLTMVNIWTTWCGYCVKEIPQLQELNEKLPKNVNLISICSDAADEKELAQKILDENGVEFITVIGNKELEDSILKYVTAFPTTVFVDSKGKIVCSPQVGAPGSEDEIVEGYLNLINDCLKKIGK